MCGGTITHGKIYDATFAKAGEHSIRGQLHPIDQFAFAIDNHGALADVPAFKSFPVAET